MTATVHPLPTRAGTEAAIRAHTATWPTPVDIDWVGGTPHLYGHPALTLTQAHELARLIDTPVASLLYPGGWLVGIDGVLGYVHAGGPDEGGAA